MRTYKAKITSFSLKTSFSLLFFLIISNVFGVIHIYAQSSSNAESFELRVANLEQQYDSQIIQILTNYFDRKKFFVDVNINAELVDEAIGTTQNQVVTNSQPRQNLFMP